MDMPAQSLWTVAAASAAAAASLTVFATTRRRDQGWPWWLAAHWAVALALLMSPWSATSRPMAAAVEALLLLWPLGSLAAVRHFHGRMHLPGTPRLDAWVGLGAGSVLLTGMAWSADSGPYALAPAAASLAAHLYAASVLFSSPTGRDGSMLRIWALLMVANAVSPVLWALWAYGDADRLPVVQARAICTAMAALVTCFLIIALVCERTERQLRDSRRRLRWLANIDALTNVPNRRHFCELAGRALSSDPEGSAALVMFDVDHFKQVNDHHGHAAGDRALRLVARCVQEVLRTDDVPGRHGGDEFVLLLRRASTPDAMAVAHRIVTGVQTLARGAGLPSITLSFGIVHLQRGEPLDDALRRADQALYEAKRQGRSRAVAASGDEERPVFTDSQSLGLGAI